MIKKHYLIAGCALLVLLIFTGNVIETESKQNVPPSNIIDNEKTVGLVPIDTQGKDILEYQSLGLSNIQTACLEKEPTMENYIGQADAIIKLEKLLFMLLTGIMAVIFLKNTYIEGHLTQQKCHNTQRILWHFCFTSASLHRD